MTVTPQQHDGFFMPLENFKPYLKLGVEGFAGSGKTYTMALVAVGLHKRIGSTKPIVIYDTEKSSKFLKPFFEQRGIPVLAKVSRSVVDLAKTISLCEQGVADILIIDSISHVWDSHLEAFKAEKRRTRIEFQDWGIIKPTWKAKVSDPFVNSAVHILMTGRAAWEYEHTVDEETKKKEIVKSGVKMRVEGEMSYEPDLLLHMDRCQELDDSGSPKVWRECTVLKDRSTLIDGMVIKNPTYEAFEPVVAFLLTGTVGATPGPEGDDKAMFREEDDKLKRRTEVTIVLEEIEGEMVARWPGQSVADKKAKGDTLERIFGTRSWTLITQMRLEDLRERLKTLRAERPRPEAQESPDAPAAAEPKAAPADGIEWSLALQSELTRVYSLKPGDRPGRLAKASMLISEIRAKHTVYTRADQITQEDARAIVEKLMEKYPPAGSAEDGTTAVPAAEAASAAGEPVPAVPVSGGGR